MKIKPRIANTKYFFFFHMKVKNFAKVARASFDSPYCQ